MFLLFRFAHFLLEVPTVRMIEHAICHERIQSVDPDESACKTALIQRQVSNVLGWKICCDAIPGVISVIYSMRLARRYGHCNVLSLCCIGHILTTIWKLAICYWYRIFPIEVSWLSSVFLFLGGGQLAFAAVITSLMADLCPESIRTRRLFILAAMPHIAKLVSPPVATLLLARSIYLPSMVSIGLNICCIILLQFARRHLHLAKSSSLSGTIASTESPGAASAFGAVSKVKLSLGIARTSLALLVACFLLAWRASSSFVFMLAIFGAGLGQSLDPASQGLLSAGLEAEDTPRSFSYMYMGTLLGDLTGGPFMSAMMSIGGSSSTASSGFNFLASSAIFTILALLTCVSKVLGGRTASLKNTHILA
ncbi:unnamed protein product [Zymoseptoria tritici ST99CH_3D7]|uniref:Major facilitator superfamily (MFS) profile domain-containing protein n=1 Tax=Zymoseptoria tritici (strain ST99CH_3D7) TaxID=1276538 RepID=A0A1X7S058_ZYMT9|nr:unnamed protein product [Zymoseptoria tritici ST99CH_3D7]